MHNRRSGRCDGRISILEVVLLLAVVLLLGGTLFAFVRRSTTDAPGETDTEATTAPARPAETPAPALAASDWRRRAPGPDGGPVDALLDEDGTDREGAGEPVDPLDGPAWTPAAGSAAALRASAVSTEQALVLLSRGIVAGRPDWDAIPRIVQYLPPELLVPSWDFLLALPWSREREATMALVMSRMTADDPVLAIEFAMMQDSRRIREAAIKTVTGVWANADPEGAFAMVLAETTESGAPVRLDVGILFAAMQRHDGAWALASVGRLSDERQQERALRGMLVDPEDPERSRDRMFDAFESIEDSAVARVAAGIIVQEWANVSPGEAAEWVGTLTDADTWRHSVLALSRQWSRVAPEEAMTWLTGLSDQAVAGEAVGHVTRDWFRDSPEGVAAWLFENRPSPVRDAVALAYVRNAGRRDPANAFAVARTVQAPAQRYQAMDRAARYWMRRDRDAATVAVLNSDLPDEIKRRYAAQAIQPRGE